MGSGEKRHLCLAVIILLLGINFIIITDIDFVKGWIFPPFYGMITIDQESEMAYVAPDQDGIINFNGSISVWFHGGPFYVGDNFLVEISAEAGEWSVSDIPPMILNRSKWKCDFNFTVYVPTGTPIWEGRTVNVTGTWKALETNATGSLRGDSALIEINPYCKLDVKSPGRVKIKAGGSGNIKVTASNKGNCDNRIFLNIDNLYEMEKRGWEFDINHKAMRLKYNETCQFNISIGVPYNARSDNYRINITILSRPDEIGTKSTPGYQGILEVKVENNFWNSIHPKARNPLVFGALVIMVIGMISLYLRKRRGNKRRL